MCSRSAISAAPEPAAPEPAAPKPAAIIRTFMCTVGTKGLRGWKTRDTPMASNGVYDNPTDLTDQSWTVMRFTEYENEATGNLEWLIRKDGCMHCEDPGCLKACPSPGAIVQYSNGIVDFQQDQCVGCG